MSKYRSNLPQLSGTICITDGGLETDFIFNRQVDLPEFASYDLLRHQPSYETLYDYFESYAQLAQRFKLGLILETVTWRASSSWGEKLGDSAEMLHTFNLKAVSLLEAIRDQFETEQSPIVISGCIGPRGDGYNPDYFMSVPEAHDYHATQITTFKQSNVDMVCALTLNYIDEAIGITLAAREFDLPVCISFTVETDGRLPTGETLEYAIQAVDKASDCYPVYYMINCAHPNHFEQSLSNDTCKTRLMGIRANASSCSHSELDQADELDDGSPEELGKQFADIRTRFPHINVLGGCCGTDHRHIEQIAIHCA